MIASQHQWQSFGNGDFSRVDGALTSLSALLRNPITAEIIAKDGETLLPLIDHLLAYSETSSQALAATIPGAALQDRIEILKGRLADDSSRRTLAEKIMSNGWYETLSAVETLQSLVQTVELKNDATILGPASAPESVDPAATGAWDPRYANTILPAEPGSTSIPPQSRTTKVTLQELPAIEQSFDIERIIGKGGMGYVAIGRSKTTGGNRVAIKFSISPEAYHQERFDAEITNSAMLLDIPQLGAATGSFRTTREHTVFFRDGQFKIPENCRCFTTVYYQASTLQEMIDFYHRLRKGEHVEAITKIPANLREWLSDDGRHLSEAFENKCRSLESSAERSFRAKIEDQFDRYRREALFPMEYFGISEASVLSNEKLQAMERRLIESVTDTARLVQAMHSKDIIHRDLKPENILVDSTSRIPLLIDFGLSRLIHASQDRDLLSYSENPPMATAESNLTQAGSVMGTLAYMPPEQTSADSARVSAAIDIYSIGAILYYIYTGHKQVADPANALDAMSCLKRIAAGEIEDPKPISPTPGRFRILESIIETAMQRDPAERYRSMRQFTEELDAWRDNNPVQSYLNGSSASLFEKLSYRTFLWMTSHPRATTIGASLGAGALALGVFEWNASGARDRAAVLTNEAAVMVKRSDPDSLAKANELLMTAGTELAPFRFTIGNYLSGATADNSRFRNELSTRLDTHQFLHLAYDAIAGTANDYASYVKKVDSNIQTLEEILNRYVPGYDQTGVAEQYLNHLDSLHLSSEENLSCRHAASHLLLNLALRLPHSPYMGLKHRSDAERIIRYLENARAIGGTDVFGASPTLAELFLERRARVATRDTGRITEIDLEIEKTEPHSGLDYYLKAKFLLDVRRDANACNRILKEGIEREDEKRIAYLRTGDRERANLARGIVANLSTVRMIALRSLRDFSELWRESSRFTELAKTYDDPQVSNIALARARAYEAVNLWVEHSRSDAPFDPERAREYRRLIQESVRLAPNPITYNNWASFERNCDDLTEAIRVCKEGLSHFPDSESLTSRLATVQAGIGQPDEAIESIFKIISLTCAATEIDRPATAHEPSAAALHEVFETRADVLDAMELYSLSDVIKSLSLSIGHVRASGQDVTHYRESAFIALEHFVNRCEANGGYGKDLLILNHRTFEPMRESDNARFGTLFERLNRLPPTLPYSKYD